MLQLYHYLTGLCWGEELHPYSEMLLMAFLNGKLERLHFLKWFHMPNSDYLNVAQCILRTTEHLGLPLVG